MLVGPAPLNAGYLVDDETIMQVSQEKGVSREVQRPPKASTDDFVDPFPTRRLPRFFVELPPAEGSEEPEDGPLAQPEASDEGNNDEP